MDNKNNTNNSWDLKKVDYETIFRNWKQSNELYTQLDEEHRQEYWNRYVFTMWWNDGRWTTMPINIFDIRKEYEKLEGKFDKFIPWIMNLLEEEGFTWEISDIFILDEHSIEFLEWIWYLQKEETKKKIIEIIWNKKTQEILWKNISFEELVEWIWDLYYDSLSVFLYELWNNVYNEKASLLLKQASGNINEAWEVCKTKVNDFLIQVEKSSEKIEFKHTHDVRGLNIDNTELAKTISKLNDFDISEFLEKLSQKIQKDWEADKWRWKIKLAGELFACAENLKKASDLL